MAGVPDEVFPILEWLGPKEDLAQHRAAKAERFRELYGAAEPPRPPRPPGPRTGRMVITEPPLDFTELRKALG